MVKTVLKKLWRVCVCGRMNAGSVTRLNIKLAEKVKKKLTFSPSGFEPCVIFSCEQEIFFFFDVKHLDYVQETALALGLPA